MAFGQADQPLARPLFLEYSGSGLTIQCLARCQLLPSRFRVHRIVSALTLWVLRPCSTLTWAANSKVPRLVG